MTKTCSNGALNLKIVVKTAVHVVSSGMCALVTTYSICPEMTILLIEKNKSSLDPSLCSPRSQMVCPFF